MRVFAINLSHRTDKKAHILNEGKKHGLDIELIEAVNGAQLTDADFQELVHDYPACCLTKGEVGCALSHLNIYKKMMDENCPLALILEDDAVLGSDVVEVLEALQRIDRNDAARAYLLSGSHYYIESGSAPLVGPYALYRIVDAFYAYAYVVNLEAAKAMYERLRPVVFEADRWMFFQQLGIVSVRCIEPAVVKSNDDEKVSSDLESSRTALILERAAYLRKVKKQFPFKVKLKKLFWKLIQRRFVKVVRQKQR